MRLQVMLMMGLLFAVGCGEDRNGARAWETDECLNGGCPEDEEHWNDDEDYYDGCYNGGCDYYEDDDFYEDPVPPADAVEPGELMACEETPACDRECVIDVASGESNCDLEQAPGRVTIDMTGHEALTIRATLIEPQGYAFHIGDSPSNNAHGGDASEFSNDAEIFLIGSGLYVYGSDHSLGDPGHVRGLPDVLGEQGGTLELTLADGMLSIRTNDDSLEAMCFVERAEDLLRLDAEDREGVPDRLWYLGLNQVYTGSRIGSGLDRVELCFH